MHKLTFHPINLLLLAISYFIALFFQHNWIDYILLLLLSAINWQVINKSLYWKNLLKFSLLMLPVSCAMLISSYYFAPADGLKIHLNNVSQINISLLLTFRLYIISIISFGYMLHLDKEKTLIELMRRKILSVNIGFAMLSVFNAFNYLTKEFNRIQIAYQMRYQRRYISPQIILPLLVSAARYAHNLSISMHNRGLNQHRSFYAPKINFTILDVIFILINLLALCCICFF